MARNGQGCFGAEHSLGDHYSSWRGEAGAGGEVLTGAASRPGARTHLQQSKEKQVRLCWGAGGSHPSPCPCPGQAGFSNVLHPQGELGARRSPALGSRAGPLGGTCQAGREEPGPCLCRGDLQPFRPSVQTRLVKSLPTAKPDVPGWWTRGSGQRGGF